MCSLAATGKPFGNLTDSTGRPLSADDIADTKAAAILRGNLTLDAFRSALDELLTERRVHQTPDGTYYIPKMVKIGEAREEAVKCGRTGGNPALLRLNGKDSPYPPPETAQNRPKNGFDAPPPTTSPGTEECREGAIPEESGHTELRYTLEACQKAATAIGMTPKQVQGFFDHYAGVNFVDGAGRQIVSLRHALAKWKANEHEHKGLEPTETDQGVLDYARQLRRAYDLQDTETTETIRRKARDNYGKGGWDRVTRAMKAMGK
jgi:hypothetical protein